MAAVAWLAFSMIKDARVTLVWMIPLATVRPAQGLRLFLIASILVCALGLLEIGAAHWWRRRGRHRLP